jgi:hypothetical protein
VQEKWDTPSNPTPCSVRTNSIFSFLNDPGGGWIIMMKMQIGTVQLIAEIGLIAPFQGISHPTSLTEGIRIEYFRRHFPRALPWAGFIRDVGAVKER